jgi:hypothetical protein
VNPFDAFLAVIRALLIEVLTSIKLERPAPYPIHVTVAEAARLTSMSTQSIRRLVRDGQLRTTNTGAVSIVLIPTVALFELDPEFRQKFPLHIAGVDEPAAPD